jgi:predicted amidophosphoribosyltransferase
VGSSAWFRSVEPWLQSVLPRSCAGCQRIGQLWCPACSAAVRSHRAGLIPAPLGTPGVLAVAGEHRDLLRAAVLLHKSRHHSGMVSDLLFVAAGALAVVRRVLPALTGTAMQRRSVSLVPVPPSSPRAWRSPAAELARGLSAGSSGVRYLPLLRARPRRHTQKSLDAAARARNVVGAFEAHPSTAAGSGLVVLIDDVVTTGATLSQARLVVEAAGYTVPAAIAITHTPGPNQ